MTNRWSPAEYRTDPVMHCPLSTPLRLVPSHEAAPWPGAVCTHAIAPHNPSIDPTPSWPLQPSAWLPMPTPPPPLEGLSARTPLAPVPWPPWAPGGSAGPMHDSDWPERFEPLPAPMVPSWPASVSSGWLPPQNDTPFFDSAFMPPLMPEPAASMPTIGSPQPLFFWELAAPTSEIDAAPQGAPQAASPPPLPLWAPQPQRPIAHLLAAAARRQTPDIARLEGATPRPAARISIQRTRRARQSPTPPMPAAHAAVAHRAHDGVPLSAARKQRRRRPQSSMSKFESQYVTAHFALAWRTFSAPERDRFIEMHGQPYRQVFQRLDRLAHMPMAEALPRHNLHAPFRAVMKTILDEGLGGLPAAVASMTEERRQVLFSRARRRGPTG